MLLYVARYQVYDSLWPLYPSRGYLPFLSIVPLSIYIYIYTYIYICMYMCILRLLPFDGFRFSEIQADSVQFSAHLESIDVFLAVCQAQREREREREAQRE